MKKIAPEMVRASQDTLASSNIVIGNCPIRTKSCLPNGARRMAKKSSTIAARRFAILAR